VNKKFLYIPPCYEPEHYLDNNIRPQDGKYKFTYLGKFYPNRREPFSLFNALKIIRQNYPELYNKLQVKLIGLNCAEYQGYVNEQSLDDVIKCEPQVDYLESMRLMKEAAVLLHFGYIIDTRKEDIFISGKLFEYLGAERLILSITRPTGPVAVFTKENKGIVCDYNDAEDIAEKIIQILSNYSIDDLYKWKSLPHVKELYSSESVAIAYKKLFKSLISDAKRA
jgi:glycosyltransferase involved in cell wall biosynthesis